MPDYISRQGEAWDQIALSRLSGEHQMGDVLALNVDELDALLLSGETRVSVPDDLKGMIISIQGKDVSMDLWPHLLSLSYTDKADDELDDLQLTLEDREGLWQGDWLPKHGDIISVTIVASNFRAPGEEELDCGEFEVDELTLESSRDGGDVVTIKGVPAAVISWSCLTKRLVDSAAPLKGMTKPMSLAMAVVPSSEVTHQ